MASSSASNQTENNLYSPTFKRYTSLQFYATMLVELQTVSSQIDLCPPYIRDQVWSQLLELIGYPPQPLGATFSPILEEWMKSPTVNLLAIELLYVAFAGAFVANPSLLPHAPSYPSQWARGDNFTPTTTITNHTFLQPELKRKDIAIPTPTSASRSTLSDIENKRIKLTPVIPSAAAPFLTSTNPPSSSIAASKFKPIAPRVEAPRPSSSMNFNSRNSRNHQGGNGNGNGSGGTKPSHSNGEIAPPLPPMHPSVNSCSTTIGTFIPSTPPGSHLPYNQSLPQKFRRLKEWTSEIDRHPTLKRSVLLHANIAGLLSEISRRGVDYWLEQPFADLLAKWQTVSPEIMDMKLATLFPQISAALNSHLAKTSKGNSIVSSSNNSNSSYVPSTPIRSSSNSKQDRKKTNKKEEKKSRRAMGSPSNPIPVDDSSSISPIGSRLNNSTISSSSSSNSKSIPMGISLPPLVNL